ncbi:FAD-dependent monooxygenase [Nocardiopsis sp. CNT-189]|uniref:FAD-dependent monooxygenase n=1 Tax=Nocardiopsis oceanisediminis TaxID=2816862 RepID=UPI003B351783
MSDIDRTPTLIIGAGPVGLVLALALSRQGIRSTIVERDPDAVRESRALNFWPRTLETFRNLGFLGDLMERGTFVTRLEPLDPRSGRPLLRLDFTGLEELSPVPGTLMCPQNTAEEVLRERVAGDPLITEVTGECVRVEQDGAGVSATVERDGGRTTLSADYLVGTDGARSTVRRCADVPMEGETSDDRMLLSDERISPSPEGWLRFALDEPGFLVGIRFGPEQWRIMGSTPPEGADEEAAARHRVRALFGDVSSTTTWASTFNVHRRVAGRYRVGRVLLAGDAAHLISPIGGQGLNAGINEAENLAWKLAEAFAGGDADLLLDSYEEECRGLMTSSISRQIDAGTRAEMSTPRWAKKLMVKGLSVAMSFPRMNLSMARSLSMLNSAYPSSGSLMVGDHSLVGSRLSDPRISGERRLSDSLAGRAAFVLCGRGPDLPPAGLPVVRVPDPPGQWGLRGESVLVVRPDRHVGAIAPADMGAEELDTLSRIVLGHRRAAA